jgi:L-aspartate oxidase
LHGANRLASNSLLEAMVYADRSAKHALENFRMFTMQDNIPVWNDEGTTHPEEMVRIVRSNLRLKRAMDRLEIIFNETEELFIKSKLSKKLCELRNMINSGYLIIKAAQQRKESRGLHFTLDYPHKNPANSADR